MMRLLGGQIGEVRSELALFEGETAETLRIANRQSFDNQAFSGVVPMIGEFMHGLPVDAAVLAVSGPVRDGVSLLPQLPWQVREGELVPVSGSSHCRLLNDLQAAAFALAETRPDEVQWLTSDARARAITPATPALLVNVDQGLTQALFLGAEGSLASEAGRASFAPRNAIERRLLNQLADQLDYVSIQQLLSPGGLRLLYDFLVREGLASATALAEIERAPDPEAEIARLGSRDLDRACAAAVAFFVEMLGATLSNLALSWLPLGGLYLTGSFLQRLKPVLAQGALMEAFLDKPDLGEVLTRVPVGVLDQPDLTLHGAKRAALWLLQRGPSASASS